MKLEHRTQLIDGVGGHTLGDSQHISYLVLQPVYSGLFRHWFTVCDMQNFP